MSESMSEYRPDPLNRDASYLIFKSIISIAVQTLKVDLPVFALPVISQLTDFVFHFVGKTLFYHLAQYLTFQIIEWKESSNLQSVQRSMSELNKAYSQGSKDDIEKSKKKFEEDFARLVRF